MERHAEKKPLLVFLVLSCLLLLVPLVSGSAVQTPRSLRLGRRSQQHQQQYPPVLKLTSSQETTAAAIAAAMDMGRPPMTTARRVVVEVNDYQPSGPNNRHDPPKGPGRA